MNVSKSKCTKCNRDGYIAFETIQHSGCSCHYDYMDYRLNITLYCPECTNPIREYHEDGDLNVPDVVAVIYNELVDKLRSSEDKLKQLQRKYDNLYDEIQYCR